SLGEGSTKPTFKVASDGTVTVRDDILFTGRTTLTSLSNINDVFVYDTSKDSDGGEWTCNDIARATSWYNEPLNTATRGKTRCFPRKAILTATNDNLFIYDAKDNSLWMRFNEGSTASTTMSIIGDTGSSHSSAHALNGKAYLGNSTATDDSGLIAIDFKSDIAHFSDNSSRVQYKGNINDRNAATLGYSGAINSLALVNKVVNDVQAALVNGKTYVAVATDSGVSIINETDSVVYSYSDVTNDDYNAAWIDSSGNLIAVNETTATLERWNTIINDTASETNGTPDTTWDESSTPALWSSTPTILTTASQLFVTSGASPVDNLSDSIYLGHTNALTQVNQKNGDQTNGSVKYYTKDYISEEMV
ncbi:MAG: hypothetical protein AAB779_00505, partial [Patescibacteria group bacterium]